MPIAIIIGASSGIGRALAVELAGRGYALGVTGRREELLETLQRELTTPVIARRMDVTQPETATAQLDALISELGGLDLLVVNAGVGIPNPDLTWEPERDTLAVNVTGFTALAVAGFRYFTRQGHGHLVGISSIAGLRGGRWNPAYSASKAFMINYLEALRGRARQLGLPIAVTDIRPGYVATAMTASNQWMFWVATPSTAARQIADAIHRKSRVAYITHRWVLIAWLVRHLPDWVLERL